MGLQVTGCRLGDAIFSDGHGDAESDSADPFLTSFHLPGQQGLVILQEPGIGGQGLSGRGQGQGFALMGEQGQAVAFFQGMDVLGDGWLGQEELPGGLGEVHGLADTEKGT